MADLFRFAQLQPYALAGAGAITGATTITLKSMTDIDGTALTMAGTFGNIGFGTLEPGNGDQEEQISFTGLTTNANGTVTLTGVKNVSFVYPYTQTSGLSKTHPGSSAFVISNTSGFYDELTAKDNDETITGTWGFTAVPNSSAAPVSGNDLTNKTYVDNLVNGGDVSIDTVIIAGTAGETIVAGNLVYLNTSDGYWWKTDADTSSTVNAVQLGIAQGAGTAGVAITGGILIKGVDPINTGLTAGSIYYASNTAGGIATSAGTTSRSVGMANAAGLLVFDPYFTQIPSGNEKAAMAGGGDFGTPSTSNKFLTEDYLVASNPTTQTYNLADSPATWTKPAGLTSILVRLWGAGGSGGARAAAAGAQSGGGGGGSYAERIFLESELGATETVTIGAGGAGVSGSNNGNNGGTSTFGSLLTAYGGGKGGQTNASAAPGGAGGGPISAADADAIGSPGSPLAGASGTTADGGSGYFSGGGAGTSGASPGVGADGGDAYLGGGGGGSTGSTASGGTTGSGGSSVFGGAGGAGHGSSSAVAGTVPGGGGGGSVGGTSGAGGDGRCIVIEYYT